MPYKSLPLFALCLFLSLSTLAQNGTFDSKLISIKDSSLDKFLLDYQIHQIPVNKIFEQLNSEDYDNNISLNFENQFDLDIYLFENDLLDYNYKIRSSNGEQASTAKAFEGNLKSSGENVRLTFNTDFIYGIIYHNSEEYYIEPLRYFNNNAAKNHFVVYNSKDVIKETNVRCGVKDKIRVSQEQNIQHQNDPSRFVDKCYIIELAIASDYLMYQAYGNSVTDVENHNIGVMNNVQIDYRSEFDDNAEFKIVEQYVATTTPDPWTASTDVNTLLNDFKAWGNTSGNFTVGFDVAQFWTTRDLADGGNTSVIGFAFVGVICTNDKYQILEDYSTTAWRLRVLTSHELGHNFNAIHDAAGTNSIMAPSVNNSSNWSFTSALDISNHISSRTCLHECDVEGAPVADFISGGTAACVGSTIEFKDISQYGETRTWTFTGGSPASSTDAKESVTYNTAGTYDVSLTSTNAAGSSTVTKVGHVLIGDPVAADCTPSGSAGAGGIYFFGLSNVAHSSSTNQIYEDNSCNVAAISLEPNTTYDLTIGLGDCGAVPILFERAEVFIDYDNDGVFATSEEVATTTPYLFCGTQSTNSNPNFNAFTTSANPVMDTLIRLRVIVDNSNITSGCYSPTTGEVEDYSVIFRSPPAGCDTVNTVTDNPASGLYEASEIVVTNGVVEVDMDASFEAGDSICLENDFEVLSTATFSAEIVNPCANFAPNEPNNSRIQIQHGSMNHYNKIIEPSMIFDLPLESNVQIFIHHKKGEVVYIPVHDQVFGKGTHKLDLSAEDLEPGVYYVSLRTDYWTKSDVWVVSN